MNMIALSFLAAQLGLALASSGGAKFDGYVTMNPGRVADLADLARDVDAMHQVLARGDGLAAAYDIYTHGGYAKSSTHVQITPPQGVEAEVPVGTVFEAEAQDGSRATALSAFDYLPGTTFFELIYHQDAPCHTGGLPDDLRNDNGCFQSPGEFKVSGSDEVYPFTSAGNLNDRTIQVLSSGASQRFRENGIVTNDYYDAFQKYVDYFGDADFADMLVEAAKDGESYAFAKGKFDFSIDNKESQANAMELISAYLNIGLAMIPELEGAVIDCKDDCLLPDCNHEAIHQLDAAVAYYTGALQPENGKGNLLYGLANDMCSQFKTCGPGGDSTTGTAKVNLDMFELFQEMQEHLGAKKCARARHNKDKIIQLLFVPLVQAFKFNIYRRSTGRNRGYFVDDTASVAAAVFPMLDACGVSEVENVHLKFGGSHVTNTLVEIKNVLEDSYECMGICCIDIGGLWSDDMDDYNDRQAPCIDKLESCLAKAQAATEAESKAESEAATMTDGDGSKTWMVVVLLVALAATMVVFYRKHRPQRFQSSSGANKQVPHDTDDDSVDSQEGMHTIA